MSFALLPIDPRKIMYINLSRVTTIKQTFTKYFANSTFFFQVQIHHGSFLHFQFLGLNNQSQSLKITSHSCLGLHFQSQEIYSAHSRNFTPTSNRSCTTHMPARAQNLSTHRHKITQRPGSAAQFRMPTARQPFYTQPPSQPALPQKAYKLTRALRWQ